MWVIWIIGIVVVLAVQEFSSSGASCHFSKPVFAHCAGRAHVLYISLVQMKAFAGVGESLCRGCKTVVIIEVKLLIVPFLRDKFPRFLA